MQQLKVEREAIVLPQLKSFEAPYTVKNFEMAHKSGQYGMFDSNSVSTLLTGIKRPYQPGNTIQQSSSQQSLPKISHQTRQSSLSQSIQEVAPPSVTMLFDNKTPSMLKFHSNIHPIASQKKLASQSLEPIHRRPQNNKLADPSYLLQQHNECRNDNLQRLNQVDRLEDLVNFKVKTIADKLREQNQSMMELQGDSLMMDSQQQYETTNENSLFLNQTSKINNSTSVFQSNLQSSENTLNLLKSICDPLLGSQWPPRLLNSHKKMERYDIPEDLKQLPKNYNKFIPIKNIIPQKEEKIEKKTEIETQEKFYKNENKKLEKEINEKLKSIEDKVKKTIEEKHNLDPQQMLMKYFDKHYNLSKKEKKAYQEFKKQIYSANYISQKYGKLKQEGKINFKEEETFYENLQEFETNEDNIFVGEDIELQNQQTANFADLTDFENNRDITDTTEIRQPDTDRFFENEKLRESQRNMKEYLHDQFEIVQNIKPSVKPRYSQLKQLQSVKSSHGDQIKYVPYTKEQLDYAQKLQKLSHKKAQKPIHPRNVQSQQVISIIDGEEQMKSKLIEQVETKQETVQPEKIVQTIVPKKLEIVFKNGQDSPKPSNLTLKSTLKGGKKLNADFSAIRSKDVPTPQDQEIVVGVSVKQIDLLTKIVSQQQQQAKPHVQRNQDTQMSKSKESAKLQSPYQQMYINQSVHQARNDTSATKNISNNQIGTGYNSAETLPFHMQHPSDTIDSARSKLDSKKALRQFITQSENLNQQMESQETEPPAQDEKYMSVTQLPKMESNRVNKQVLMNDPKNLIIISTELPKNPMPLHSVIDLNRQVHQAYDSQRAPAKKSPMGGKLVSISHRKKKEEGFSPKRSVLTLESNRKSNASNIKLIESFDLAMTTMRQQSLTSAVKVTEKDILDKRSFVVSKNSQRSQKSTEAKIQQSRIDSDAQKEQSKKDFVASLEQSRKNSEVIIKASNITKLDIRKSQKINLAASTSTLNQAGIASLKDLNEVHEVNEAKEHTQDQPSLVSNPSGSLTLDRILKQEPSKTSIQNSDIFILPTQSDEHSQESKDKIIELTDDQKLLDDYIYNHLIQRSQWIPSRFKKFPRFGRPVTNKEIFDHYDEQLQYISLNQDVIDMLSNKQASSQMLEQNQSLITSSSPKRRNHQLNDDRKDTLGLEEIENGQDILILTQNKPEDSLNMSDQIFSAKGLENTLSQIDKSKIIETKAIVQSHFNGNSRAYDPFLKVLLTKQIDNQILTSNRTIMHLNNVFSDTQKIIHNKFKAPESFNQTIQKQIKGKKELYAVDEIQVLKTLQAKTLEPVATAKTTLHRIDVHKEQQKESFDQKELTQSIEESQDEVYGETKISKPTYEDSRKQIKIPTTLTKEQKIVQLISLPISVYDISAGLKNEESGFGYKRSQYVVSTKKMSQERPPLQNIVTRNTRKQVIASMESEDTKKQEELDEVLELEMEHKLSKIKQAETNTQAKPSPRFISRSIDAKSSLNNTKSTIDFKKFQPENARKSIVDTEIDLQDKPILDTIISLNKETINSNDKQTLSFITNEPIQQSRYQEQNHKQSNFLVKEIRLNGPQIEESGIVSSNKSMLAMIEGRQDIVTPYREDVKTREASVDTSNRYGTTQKQFVSTKHGEDTQFSKYVDTGRSMSYKVDFPAVAQNGKNLPISVRVKNLQRNQDKEIKRYYNLEPAISPRRSSVSPSLEKKDENAQIVFPLLPTGDPKPESIQKYINKVFDSEVRYEKKVFHRDDLVQSNSLIFNMGKYGNVKVTRNDTLQTQSSGKSEAWVTGSNIQVGEIKPHRKGLNPTPLRKK